MSEYTHERLQFAMSDSPISIDGLTVYESLETEFVGATFEFDIIGSSHSISSPELDYFEVSSCKEIDADEVSSITLTSDLSLNQSYKGSELSSETWLKTMPLSAYPRTVDFDVHYRFDEDAFTSIALYDDSYETWHTYPEFDRALLTRTRIVRHEPPVQCVNKRKQRLKH